MKSVRMILSLLLAIGFLNPLIDPHEPSAAASSTSASNVKSGSTLAVALAELSEYILYGVTKDGWIYYDEYYYEPGSQKQKHRQMKKKIDGSGLQEVKGEQLIRPTAPGRTKVDHIDYNLRVVSDKEPFLKKLASNQNVQILSIDNNRVIYWVGEITSFGYDEPKLEKGVIKRAKLDGSQQNIVITDPGNIELSEMTVYKDFLFYTVNLDKTRNLYRIGLDGKNKKLITDDYGSSIARMNNNNRIGEITLRKMYQQSEPIQIWNDQIVYRSSKGGIYRIQSNGTGKVKLSSHEPTRAMIDGQVLYYGTERVVPGTTKRKDEFGPVYQVSLLGGKPVAITKGGSEFLFAQNGWVYTQTDSHELDQQLIRIKPGVGSQALIKGLKGSQSFGVQAVYGPIIVYGFYSLQENTTFRRMNLDGSDNQIVPQRESLIHPKSTVDYKEEVKLNYGKYQMPKTLQKILDLQEQLGEKKLLDYEDLLGMYFYEDGVNSRYLNTPLDVITFASPGVDGIHYGFLTDFGTVEDLEKAYIVRVDPMNFDDPVRIVARNLHDFLRMLVDANTAASILDIDVSEETYREIMKPDPDAWEPGRDEVIVDDTVRKTFNLEPMPDAYAYFQQVKKEREKAAIVPTADSVGVVVSAEEAKNITRFDFTDKEEIEEDEVKAFFAKASRASKLVFLREAQSLGLIDQGGDELQSFLKEELTNMGLVDEAGRIGYPNYEDSYSEGDEEEQDWSEEAVEIIWS